MKRKLCAILCAVLLAGSLVPSASAAGVTFTDVPQGAWYYDVVTHLADAKVVSGKGNGRFDPQGNVTRAEMVKMVVADFFQDECDAYMAQYADVLRYLYGAEPNWFIYLCDYAMDAGLLNLPYGFLMDLTDYASCTAPMTRYEMAAIVSNTAKVKGITATDAQKAAAQTAITDYAAIPITSQEAVKSCFALGLLSGKTGGVFDGDKNMTRAEACQVIVNIEKLFAQGVPELPTISTPTDPTSVTSPADVKEIQVSSHTNPANALTSWTVPDNGFASGYLNNGKPITEENVLELLAEAEKIWPSGMAWGERNNVENNMYQNPSNIITSAMGRAMTGTVTNLNTSYGCGGFAAIISDYLFGRNNNPVHLVTDMTKIRPGDVILHVDKDANRILHASISVSSAVTRISPEGREYPGCVWTADGNGNQNSPGNNGQGKIRWPGELEYKYGGPQNQDQVFVGHNVYWIVWSRYPD